MDDSTPADSSAHWGEKAKLLESGMEFSNEALFAVQDTILKMIRAGSPTGAAEFKTPGGRRAAVVITVDSADVDPLITAYGGN